MNDDIKIIYGEFRYIPSYYKALKHVANEKIYIEMIEPPSFGKVKEFQESLIERNGPVFYALSDHNVVGWCDIFPINNPRQSHRGRLGMGLLPEYRGKGIGSKLLKDSIQKAKEFKLEKIELTVYTTNSTAISLYKKFDFIEEGMIKKYRKLDEVYYDCLSMAKFLD